MTEGSVLLIHLSSLLWVLGALGFVVSSIWLSVVDLATRRLPNRLVGWSTAVTLGLLAASSAVRLPTASRGAALEELLRLAGGAAVLFAAFYLLWRLAPRGFGGGDVKAAPLAGGALGFFGGFWALLVCAVVAFGVVAIWGAVARRGGSQRSVPFAPCLFAGAWIVLLSAPLVMILG